MPTLASRTLCFRPRGEHGARDQMMRVIANLRQSDRARYPESQKEGLVLLTRGSRSCAALMRAPPFSDPL